MTAPLAVDWAAKASALRIPDRIFIDGKFVPSSSGKTFRSVNPASGKVLGAVSEGDAEDIDRAVKAARRAFEKGSWSRMAPAERKRRLGRLATLMEEHREELALLETLDGGKPIRDSFNGDVPSSANCIRWYGEAIDKVYDEIAPTTPSAMSLIRREPLGVVGAVVPWNFPLLMAAWKIGPVLATGNSLVLKPAEQTPLSILLVAQLAIEAGIPEGVFNVVPGYGEMAGRALGMHNDVDAITFTGSTEVGKLFMKYSGDSNMKRVSLECGGKSPNIVLADTPDLDAAATATAWGIFYNQGQVCNAGSRLIVQESVRDELLDKIANVARTIKQGDPLNPETQLGPLVDETQTKRVTGYIEKGVREGASLYYSGGATKANYVAPTVFDKVRNDMVIAREEIFGPVLATIPVKDAEEAITIANDTIYGLASAIWTKDINVALNASRRLRSGIVWVNCFDEGDITTPFGGFKQTGFGRDKSIHALDKYTDLKATWIKLDGGA
jgi:gamma-glutamyl-gamma-aminobutyraldehyde dehydrogenase/4-guanidinobutyraldehyde dehydrogenase/NAD-dependent aldehyde dehydrogenase